MQGFLVLTVERSAVGLQLAKHGVPAARWGRPGKYYFVGFHGTEPATAPKTEQYGFMESYADAVGSEWRGVYVSLDSTMSNAYSLDGKGGAAGTGVMLHVYVEKEKVDNCHSRYQDMADMTHPLGSEDRGKHELLWNGEPKDLVVSRQPLKGAEPAPLEWLAPHDHYYKREHMPLIVCVRHSILFDRLLKLM